VLDWTRSHGNGVLVIPRVSDYGVSLKRTSISFVQQRLSHSTAE